MTKVIGLVSDQEKAEQVVNDLTKSRLGEMDIHTIDRWDENATIPSQAAPAYDASSGAAGIPALMKLGIPSFEFNSDEEEQYFKRGVQDGGILITVEPDDDDDVSHILRILKQESDRVVKV